MVTDDIHMARSVPAVDGGLLVKELRDRLGDDLRAVALHAGRDYEVIYRRERLSADDASVELDHAVEELVVQGIQGSRLGQLFDAGTLDCLFVALESSLVVYTALEGRAGLLVTIERGAVADVESIAATLSKHS